MSNTAEDLLFDLTLSDDQRMNRETMQRFAAQEIRELAQSVDKGDTPTDSFYPKTADLGLDLTDRLAEHCLGHHRRRRLRDRTTLAADLDVTDHGVVAGAR